MTTVSGAITTSALETAGVTFAGAFASAYELAGASITGAILVGIVAAAGVLGYHAVAGNVTAPKA